MNANDAYSAYDTYSTDTAEITTTENVAYMTVGDTIPPMQNVTYGHLLVSETPINPTV